jgi:hypothetical protein
MKFYLQYFGEAKVEVTGEEYSVASATYAGEAMCAAFAGERLRGYIVFEDADEWLEYLNSDDDDEA